MARRLKLTDFQRHLSERLAQAANRSLTSANRLGVRTGERQWLLRLDQAGEVLFTPEVYDVPLAKTWFRGLANVRGHLLSVMDWSQFCGGDTATLNYRSRLIVLSDKLATPCALLVGAVVGLRNVDSFEPQSRHAANAPWIVAAYRDADGQIWEDVDLTRLVGSAAFLEIEAA